MGRIPCPPARACGRRGERAGRGRFRNRAGRAGSNPSFPPSPRRRTKKASRPLAARRDRAAWAAGSAGRGGARRAIGRPANAGRRGGRKDVQGRASTMAAICRCACASACRRRGPVPGIIGADRGRGRSGERRRSGRGARAEPLRSLPECHCGDTGVVCILRPIPATGLRDGGQGGGSNVGRGARIMMPHRRRAGKCGGERVLASFGGKGGRTCVSTANCTQPRGKGQKTRSAGCGARRAAGRRLPPRAAALAAPVLALAISPPAPNHSELPFTGSPPLPPADALPPLPPPARAIAAGLHNAASLPHRAA